MTAPQPGWYDDPENPAAQRYWDGQNWTPHRQRKDTAPTTPDPAGVAPSPPPPLPPPPAIDTTKPSGFWLKLTRPQKLLIVGGAAVVAIIGLIIAFSGGGGLPFVGDPPVDTSSQSYQMGLKTGTDGQAEIAAYGGFNIFTHQFERRSHQDACEGEWRTDNGANPDLNLNHRDYMAGCLYGLDHNANSPGASHAPPRTVVPPSKKGSNGGTVPNTPGS